jgi:hypothetical protein
VEEDRSPQGGGRVAALGGGGRVVAGRRPGRHRDAASGGGGRVATGWRSLRCCREWRLGRHWDVVRVGEAASLPGGGCRVAAGSGHVRGSGGDVEGGSSREGRGFSF